MARLEETHKNQVLYVLPDWQNADCMSVITFGVNIGRESLELPQRMDEEKSEIS